MFFLIFLYINVIPIALFPATLCSHHSRNEALAFPRSVSRITDLAIHMNLVSGFCFKYFTNNTIIGDLSSTAGVQYLGPLDAYTDISSLAGRTLIVSDKDSGGRRPGGHITLQKAASVGYRSTSNRLFTSTSTDETYDQSPKAASSSSNKQSKQKWTISFGSKVNNIWNFSGRQRHKINSFVK